MFSFVIILFFTEIDWDLGEKEFHFYPHVKVSWELHFSFNDSTEISELYMI